MSSYGAAAFQYKHQIPVVLKSTYALDNPMISPSIHSKSSTSQEIHSLNNSTEVEIGRDPLSDPQHQVDSYLSDYSFCNVDLKECSSPKPGTE
jgi:hypothetical protein